jgi:hypothetical protein
MIVKSFHFSAFAVTTMALMMTSYLRAEPSLNWNAAARQGSVIKTLPALKQPGLPQSQFGTSERANELNPQPLPPAKPNPGDSLKSSVDNRTKPLTGLPAANPLNKDKANAQISATAVPKNIFSLEDRAIIIVGGKSSSAGEVKKALLGEIAKKAGPPKIVKGGARPLDLAALNVTKGAINSPAPPVIGSGSALNVPASRGMEAMNSLSAVLCLDKGPPLIDEVEKRLKPGTRVIIWGFCLGDRPGRVEIIGQFPGGKLTPAFTSWNMTSVEIEIPANVRGAIDHAVAVSIVTADGKTTPAKQAQFVASRERVDVPERLWSPTAKFELSATGGAAPTNAAYSGQLSRTLRINPQCALYEMDALVLSGAVTEIRGWGTQGLPNEASVSIDWMGTCTEKTTISQNNYVVYQEAASLSYNSACRVAFQTQASAYCPAGIAP